ncbi:CYTH domain-containing protein [Streptococcus intermedius]|uniref:CYTH domain-containing protein n=1 Tax=Streptococcus intermedius TaxID=1338 RepID=UPI000F6639FB|nr:CYTH domain-containing protein [Streptococcus intermedius]RSJ16646.1 nucleoside triphosphate pyrophosphohydrolase [Streptococcus intermedius]
MIATELEKKYLLTKEEYFSLRREFFKSAKSQEQINYYFDSLDFSLLKRGITLRIRKKDDKYNLTLKKKKSIKIIVESEEREFLISPKDFQEAVLTGKFPENVQKELDSLIPKKKIFYLGFLKTERQVIEKNSLLYCLDKNNYFEKEDFELEIEGTKEGLEKIEVDISKKEANRIGKYTRFIDELLKGNGNHLIKTQVSAIILNKESDKICLIKKDVPTSSIHNMWLPPGGHIDFGENLVDAVKREVHEETGLKVIVRRLSSIVSFQQQKGKQAICFFYITETQNSDEISVSEPGIECRWFALKDVLCDGDLNMTDYHRIILSDLNEKRILYLDLKKTDNQYNVENRIHI